MAGGDDQRLGPGPRAKQRSDALASVPDITAITRRGTRAGLARMANEHRLCHADGWQVHRYAEMGGNAKPTGVGDTLAIDHNQVRQGAQLLPGHLNRRKLAEREEPRYIGQRRVDFCPPLLDQGQSGPAQDNDGGANPLSKARSGAINAGDDGHRTETSLLLHAQSELPL